MAGLASKFSLVNKVALVTGSTSGIGLGIARSLASNGANIILNGFGNPSDILALRKEIEGTYKVKTSFEGADLANPAEIEKMMHNCHKSFPDGVDILVNNAGIQHVAPIDKFPVDRWNAVININLNAVFHTTRLALPSMKQKNWGRIINVASVHGTVGSADKSAYVAAKHGVVGLGKVVALELAKTNITCNTICPGWVLTPLVAQQIQARADAAGISFEEAKSKLLCEKQPSGEFVTPGQLGDLAVFLSSESASQVRGVAWVMDGGWTAQ